MPRSFDKDSSTSIDSTVTLEASQSSDMQSELSAETRPYSSSQASVPYPGGAQYANTNDSTLPPKQTVTAESGPYYGHFPSPQFIPGGPPVAAMQSLPSITRRDTVPQFVSPGSPPSYSGTIPQAARASLYPYPLYMNAPSITGSMPSHHPPFIYRTGQPIPGPLTIPYRPMNGTPAHFPQPPNISPVPVCAPSFYPSPAQNIPVSSPQVAAKEAQSNHESPSPYSNACAGNNHFKQTQTSSEESVTRSNDMPAPLQQVKNLLHPPVAPLLDLVHSTPPRVNDNLWKGGNTAADSSFLASSYSMFASSSNGVANSSAQPLNSSVGVATTTSVTPNTPLTEQEHASADSESHLKKVPADAHSKVVHPASRAAPVVMPLSREVKSMKLPDPVMPLVSKEHNKSHSKEVDQSIKRPRNRLNWRADKIEPLSNSDKNADRAQKSVPSLKPQLVTISKRGRGRPRKTPFGPAEKPPDVPHQVSSPRTSNSCWTCKLRRKKCDSRRPKCETCEHLGIECMGYAEMRPDYMISAKKNKEMRARVTRLVQSNRDAARKASALKLNVEEVRRDMKARLASEETKLGILDTSDELVSKDSRESSTSSSSMSPNDDESNSRESFEKVSDSSSNSKESTEVGSNGGSDNSTEPRIGAVVQPI